MARSRKRCAVCGQLAGECACVELAGEERAVVDDADWDGDDARDQGRD